MRPRRTAEPGPIPAPDHLPPPPPASPAAPAPTGGIPAGPVVQTPGSPPTATSGSSTHPNPTSGNLPDETRSLPQREFSPFTFLVLLQPVLLPFLVSLSLWTRPLVLYCVVVLAPGSPPCSLRDNGQLDFSDPAATMQLTKTLLALDFGLKLDLPDDRLCPPVRPAPLVKRLDKGTMTNTTPGPKSPQLYPMAKGSDGHDIVRAAR
jgi:hypothetical protein